MSKILSRGFRQPFEFQRQGPLARPPGGHKPDFTLTGPTTQITKNPQQTTQPVTKTNKNKTVALDTLFLVDILGTSHFENVQEIDASSKHLNYIDLTALGMLSTLEKADFSDNALPLEPFAILPKLKELDLSCNSLRSFDYKSSETMSGDERAWPCLVSLNLSFNNCGRSITDLQLITHLTTLNLSHNNLTSLPSNLMHFTCLTNLDLTGNSLNSEPAFFSLATIQSLQTLILDKNGIFHIPKFQFGFESLAHISLRGNSIEMADDITSLADLELLEDVNICDNPLVLRPKQLPIARQAFNAANIDLRTDEPLPAVVRHTLNVATLRTIPLDPLTLPSFTKQHINSLNRQSAAIKSADKLLEKTDETKSVDSMSTPLQQTQSTSLKSTTSVATTEDDIFMTAFGSMANEPPQFQPPPEPEPQEPEEEVAEEEQPIISIWNEVPVVNAERRKKLSGRTRGEFMTAFRRLEFVVSHPDLRLKPKKDEKEKTQEEQRSQTANSEQSLSEKIAAERETSILQPKPATATSKKPKEIAQKLAARTEYTKSEIQQMLKSMSDRLGIVERDLHATDESGQSAVDIAIDQKNFSELHKKYEVIRAELINTLNS
ncbi:Leucine Rich Repeat family protein [Trichomonas vaginalis G3]|uniref:Leucine Rich Repeat family protein n=1 Tax=Trichomonas vaginalis (strain ATCC PRA-98 / G3) TaxID=412133 RepID=A2F7X9_TRIV3|nr:uncharacterized protein TVAGG3_0671500 [Trichomonas vaginalis G3]EAX98973.1 Leucine Rich Repeat family protein [Trichomonas vaginalis G3]KAI5507231.1 norepinephrine secretion [Trichomonas vaginalis G3]|eukprot:XP_001311903.1 hypothetical protein [Trichomonas vaginalis G3]